MNHFEIREIPVKGRAMIATKGLAAGVVIFEEEPFVSSQFSWNTTHGYASCYHCMRPLETVQENVRRLASDPHVEVPLPQYDPTTARAAQFTQCERCEVRYCSEDCLMEAQKRYVFTTSDAYKTLMVIMGTHSQGIATSVQAQWVNKVTDLPLPDAERAQLVTVIDNLYTKMGEFLNNEGSGLYLLQSKINHSCVPNACSTFPYSNDIVVLKALSPILEGEEICISYLDDCQLERSRHSRHKVLRENCIFGCQCPKCRAQASDPDVASDKKDDDKMNDYEDDDNIE
ncbi:hypothetical protein KR009_006024, partial [Drosophila setifemur]